MRMQRYPDGANHWTLSIWSRHPSWSMTWTHGISLTKHRKESGQRRFGFYAMPSISEYGQSHYGVTFFGFDLQLSIQAASPKVMM